MADWFASVGKLDRQVREALTMSGESRDQIDQVDQLYESAKAKGAFASADGRRELREGLEAVEQQIAHLTRTDPGHAASLYEAFYARCRNLLALDDSLHSLIGKTTCGWVKARQAAGEPPEETAEWLLDWMLEDPCAFFFQLERPAVPALSREGLDALEGQVNALLDKLATGSAFVDPYGCKIEYQRRRCIEMLRLIYRAQGKVERYALLAEEMGLTAEDCHNLATMCVAQCKPEDALRWVERGLELDACDPCASMRFDLTRLKRDLFEQIGRAEGA
jgi:hypothetical protein